MSLEKHGVIGLQSEIENRKTLFSRPDRLHDPLYVVTTIFNATRYRSRWRLYEDFAKHVAEAGAVLYTVEVAFGERDFAVTQPDDPHDLQLRTTSELWLKENALNLGVQRLPQDWKYVAWIDADTHFTRSDWANETIHALQHYSLVQMWSQYQDLTSDHELIGTASSFAANYLNNGYTKPKKGEAGYGYYPYGKRGYPGAPGLAWACRRDAWDALSGLLDICILGAADWYCAHALIGQLNDIVRPEYTDRYKSRLLEWQNRAEIYIKRNLGVISGLALHYWHGPKVNRKYGTRDQILIKNKYDPSIDLKRDWQGLYQLVVDTPRQIKLRDDIRKYFRQRNEDAI